MKIKGNLIGAFIGTAIFLVTSLVPSLVYGGYAGLLLAGGIFGIPVEATLLPRMLIVFGMILGAVAGASIFTIFGAVIGSTFDSIFATKQAKSEA